MRETNIRDGGRLDPRRWQRAQEAERELLALLDGAWIAPRTPAPIVSQLHDAAPCMRRRVSLAARLAAYFQHRPGVWIDGRELAAVAGLYAWRTRLSELRRDPFHMRIGNRQRHIHREDGSTIAVSEYRFEPVEARA